MNNAPVIRGVGYVGEGVYSKRKNGIAYKTWHRMIDRVHDAEYLHRYPSYKNCSIIKEWYNFQIFCKWFEENYIKGFDLDKDLLVKGNKIYGPNFCMFVPSWVNKLFNTSSKSSGDLPTGVQKARGAFSARCSMFGKRRYGRERITIREAHIDYLNMRVIYLSECVTKDDFPNTLCDSFLKRINDIKFEIKELTNV